MDYDFGDKKFDVFLSALEAGHTVDAAHSMAGLSWKAIYGLKKSEPKFAEAWAQAILAGGRSLPVEKQIDGETITLFSAKTPVEESHSRDNRFGVFLSALEAGQTVDAARLAAGLSWKAIYGLRNGDPQFAEAWEQAIVTGGRPLPKEKTIDREAIKIFLDAIASGALIEASAEKAGFNVASFYKYKKKDLNFASEWEEATARGKVRKFLEGKEPAVRIFLEAVETGNSGLVAANKAGFDLTTFYRLKREDPNFGDRWKTAMVRGRCHSKYQPVADKNKE